jgi:putative aldouronate transport system substrate-binding protein
MKKIISVITLTAAILSLTSCGGGSTKKEEGAGIEKLVSDYGFQWKDTNAPILNDKGASEISFNIYSSKNASAIDYNDMKIMQDLFDSTNVNVNWENVSESVYLQQKNLISENSSDRPDALYHAGMSQGRNN